ncbi:hypothetical protein VPH35_114158 [Triticum aestivum]
MPLLMQIAPSSCGGSVLHLEMMRPWWRRGRLPGLEPPDAGGGHGSSSIQWLRHTRVLLLEWLVANLRGTRTCPSCRMMHRPHRFQLVLLKLSTRAISSPTQFLL